MPIASPARPGSARPEPVQRPTPRLFVPASPPELGTRISPRRDLFCSMGDAGAYSVMVGIGETYFAAFALALGTGKTFAGLVATLPMLAGAFLQLATPYAVR